MAELTPAEKALAEQKAKAEAEAKAKLLAEKDYKVYGLIKRYSNPNLDNINWLGIENDIELVTGDITDDSSINHIVRSIKPHEFYNLAAQSFVGASWELNKLTTEVNSLGTLNVLNACLFYTSDAADE